MNPNSLISTNERLISNLEQGSAASPSKRNWLAWLENFLVPRHRRSMNG